METLLNIRETAAILHISRSMTYELVKRGDLRAVVLTCPHSTRRPSRILIDPADLRDFIESCKTPPEAMRNPFERR